jgi:membrane protease YdiL (CAAX protease family)
VANRAESEKTGKQPRLGLAIEITLVLWAVYTLVYTLPLGDALSAGLELIPGILGLTILTMGMRFTPDECYLQMRPLSKKGLALLMGFFIALIPILLSGRWVGWNWTSGLIYAPASGVAQELFFRASLLPVTIKMFKHSRLLAVFVQSALFAVWHVPLAVATAPLGGAIAVVIVTFIGGMLWGWQVQRDRTMYWAMCQHIIYLVLMSLFVWE